LRVFALIPAAAAVLASACAAAAGGGYRVQPGDTLTAIAQAHGTTVIALERLNRFAPGAPLLAGAVLRLPGAQPAVTHYVVRPGDSLTALAQRFGTTAAALARASGLRVNATLLIGTRLTVAVPASAPPARPRPVYTVEAGDTLTAIAGRFGVSVGELADLNHLVLSAPLYVGARLSLPRQTLAETSQPADRSTVRGSLVYWSNHYGVDPRLATALAWMESGFNNDVVSPVGAAGVMQITPDTWNYVEQVLLLGRSVPHDADGNVRIGVALLHHLLRAYGGDVRRTLAAYYQGPRSLQVNGFLPGTEQYVDDILALRARF
jgi:LysM repeat protein